MKCKICEENLEIKKLKTYKHFWYFCNKCKNYVLGDCKLHKKRYLKDISGTNFRKNILSNKIFLHADKNMQEHLLINNHKKIFVK